MGSLKSKPKRKSSAPALSKMFPAPSGGGVGVEKKMEIKIVSDRRVCSNNCTAEEAVQMVVEEMIEFKEISPKDLPVMSWKVNRIRIDDYVTNNGTRLGTVYQWVVSGYVRTGDSASVSKPYIEVENIYGK